MKIAQLLKIRAQMSSIWAKGCMLMIVCVLSDLTWLLLLGWGRKSWYIITKLLFTLVQQYIQYMWQQKHIYTYIPIHMYRYICIHRSTKFNACNKSIVTYNYNACTYNQTCSVSYIYVTGMPCPLSCELTAGSDQHKYISHIPKRPAIWTHMHRTVYRRTCTVQHTVSNAQQPKLQPATFNPQHIIFFFTVMISVAFACSVVLITRLYCSTDHKAIL